MKVIENILYLELSDGIICGLGSDNYIRKEKSRGAKWGVFIKDPSDKRRMLIEFESLHPTKKEKVISFFGNPYDYYSKNPIRNMAAKDGKAEEFYYNYRFENENSLSEESIKKYTTAASWLNMLIKAQEDFKSIKNQLSITASKFWIQVCEIIEEDKISLPSNYTVLLKKIKTYKISGYETLIHKLAGKKSNAAKIDDEVSEAVLLELISMPNADDVMTSRRYNTWATENNKAQITSRTVTNWKLENKHLISLEKYGTKENYNNFGKHIARSRPSAPLLLVEHDDNELDLYFQNIRTKKGRTEIYYYNRFVIAVVIDAYNDYPLGWAIAETYTKELIRFAYLDAAYHIKELTGSWYLPHQIRSDRFGLDVKLENDLAQFYKSLATYTPATVKLARSKYIERSFGDNWHQVLSCYKNYSGTNITSKHHVSQEFIEANKRTNPTTEQAPSQVYHFINVMRHLVNEKTGLSRQEQWIKAFNESEKSKKYLISEIQLLAKLGTPHQHLNKISCRGITPAINCVERIYEIPEELYLKTVGRTVQVIYDPMDYSRILVTDNESLLFIAREQELMPSALADFKEGDRTKLNDRLQEKQRHMEFISKQKKTRQDVLQLNRIQLEGYAMAGVHSKAINHQVTVGYSPVTIEQPKVKQLPGQLYDPVDDM